MGILLMMTVMNHQVLKLLPGVIKHHRIFMIAPDITKAGLTGAAKHTALLLNRK